MFKTYDCLYGANFKFSYSENIFKRNYEIVFHASFVRGVIILFNTDLYKSGFSNYFFKELIFYLSMLYALFFLYQVLCDFVLTKELLNKAACFRFI